MAWIAGVIAVFLFYQYVERRHKRIVLWCLLALLLVGSLAAGGMYYHNYHEDKQRAQSISITVSFNRLILDATEKKRRADLVWNDENFQNSIERSLPKLPSSQRTALRDFILGSYYERTFREDEFEVISDEEMEAATKGGETWETYCVGLVDRFLEGLPELRKKNQDTPFSTITSIWSKHNWCNGPKAQKRLKAGVLPEERASLDVFVWLRSDALRRMYEILNADANLQSELNLNVCNKRDVPLASYSFDVSGFLDGRSTPLALSYEPSPGGTHLNSDIIIPPNSCSPVSYSGKYRFYHQYRVANVSGKWEE